MDCRVAYSSNSGARALNRNPYNWIRSYCPHFFLAIAC